jgi:hypothetical protein
MFLMRSDVRQLTRILTLSVLFFLVEQLFSLIVRGTLEVVRFDLIILLVLSITYKDIAVSYYQKFRQNKNSERLLNYLLAVFCLMFFIFIFQPSLADSLNYYFSGYPQFFGRLGVSYFSPEPGLSTFGILSLLIMYKMFSKKNELLKDLIILFIIVLLLLSTLSLTGVLVALIAVYVCDINMRVIFWILFSLAVLSLIFSDNFNEVFFHPLSRIEALFNLVDYQDASPAIRVNSILILGDNFLDSYRTRVEYGAYPVGFVSYITLLPFISTFIIFYHLIKLPVAMKFIFIFSVIMMPLTSPFIFALYLLDRIKIEKLKSEMPSTLKLIRK